MSTIESENLALWFDTTTITILRLLVATPGFDVNAIDTLSGHTKLSKSLNDDKDASLIKYLLSIPGIDVNKVNNYGAYPLHYATKYEIVKLLVAAGANINAISKNGNSPIMVNKDDKSIKYLVEQGADLTITNKRGETVFNMDIDPDLLKSKIDTIYNNFNELNGDEKLSVVEKTSMGLSKEQKSKLIQKILASF